VTLRERLGELVARRHLRACTRLGARPVLRGTPFIYNTGELVVGEDFLLGSSPVRSHLYVTGRMSIGHRVRIGAGAAISALGRVDIEDDVALGEFVIVMDSDFHVADDFHAEAAPRPVRIGRGARLGHRVVVLPGSTIGAGAVVKASSVVSGDVAENAVVEGNPARSRLIAQVGGAGAPIQLDVPQLVMQVLGLRSLPDMDAGPEQITQWDSLGTLRLIVALEETFAIALPEEQVRAAGSIRELAGHVEAARIRKTGAEAQLR